MTETGLLILVSGFFLLTLAGYPEVRRRLRELTRGQRPTLWTTLRDRDFGLLWASGTLANTSRWMDSVAMGLLVLQQTDSPFQVALLFVLRWIPMFAFAIFSGMIADRANRWLVVAATRVGAVLITAIILCLVAIDTVQPWHLLLASLALGCIYVLEFPSRRSFIYDLVGSRFIVSAMSLESLGSTIGRFIGPLTAGLFIQLAGFTGTYVVLVCGYGLALLFFALIKARFPAQPGPVQSIWRDFIHGLAYSLKHRVIRSVLAVTLIMNALAFSVESLFPVIARDHLNVGPGMTGVLISAQSIGSFVAATAIGWFGIVKYHGRVYCLGITLQLLSLLLFALSPWYAVSFVILAVSGVGTAGFGTMQSTIILMSASPEMRGMTIGVLGQCIGVAAFGGLLVGAVAGFFNAQVPIAVSASIGLILLIPVVSFSPLVWRPITPYRDDPSNSGSRDTSGASQPLD